MRPRRMYVFLLLALVFLGCSGARAGECRDEVLGGVYPALTRNTLGERTTLLCNMAFIEMVSGVSHDPLWSAEHLTRDEILSARHQVRRGIFHEETRQPKEDRATLSDYRRSGFDRGHMTPSGDAPTALAQQQTFSLANMVPQTPDLNRGPWAGIEQAVRDLARREGEVYVVTGPAFRTDHVVTIGRSHVYVPTSIWKAVYRPSLRGAGVYVCRNLVTPTCDRVPVAALIRVTGIDPFPGLSDDVKAHLVDLPDWRVPHYHVAPKLRRQTLDVLGQVLTRWLGQFGTE